MGPQSASAHRNADRTANCECLRLRDSANIFRRLVTGGIHCEVELVGHFSGKEAFHQCKLVPSVWRKAYPAKTSPCTWPKALPSDAVAMRAAMQVSLCIRTSFPTRAEDQPGPQLPPDLLVHQARHSFCPEESWEEGVGTSSGRPSTDSSGVPGGRPVRRKNHRYPSPWKAEG